jgi:hypothetical protein
MTKQRWKTLITCVDEIRANLIASALHEEDIPAITHNQKDSVYVMLGSVYVLVPEDQIQKSRKVLIDEDIVEPEAFEGEE